MLFSHLRIAALYFILFGSVIVGLILGSELVRWLMAGALAIVAVPLWSAMKHSIFNQKLNEGEHTLDLLIADLIENDDHQAKP